MALKVGTRLAYEVTEPLGAGGMGEVYRAHDTRLKRDVALKVLPEAFASDTERLARFHREAEVLATLNHPQIAAIYGIEESEICLRWSSSSSRGKPSPIGLRAARFPQTRRSRSPLRSRRPSKPRTNRASFTGI